MRAKNALVGVTCLLFLSVDVASKDTFVWKLGDNPSEIKNSKKIVIGVKGLLEVRKNQGNWMRMCNDWTDNRVKNVTCRQMGYLGVNSSNYKGTEQLGILPQNFSCPSGTEKDITFCTIPPPSTDKCRTVVGTDSLAVEVSCNTNVGLLGLLNVELQGGDAHSGTLEYTSDGKKTPVCYNTSNAESVASVVCKQMGYSDKIKASSVASNATEFASLECLGSEQTLDACTFENHVSSCTRSLVVAVECKLDMTSQKFFDVRLSSPDRSLSQGTVEVWKYGYWGVICDNDWTTQEADVVCRQLGYSKATDAPKNALYGQGTGVVFWDKVNCTGNEFSIADCPHSTAVVSVPASTRDSTKAAGVNCNTTIQVESKDICEDAVVSLEPGITFIQSPDFPETFEYSSSSNNICSRSFTSPTNFTVYIQQKMFHNNHNESLSFKTSAGRVETFYGDNSTQGLMTFDTEILTIEFQANGVAGKGKISIMVTVPQPPHSSPTPASPITVSNASITTAETVNVGVIVGPIVGVVCFIIVLGIIVIVLWKRGVTCLVRKTRTPDGHELYDETPVPNGANTRGLTGKGDSGNYANVGEVYENVSESVYVNSAFAADQEMEASQESDCSSVYENMGDIVFNQANNADNTTALAEPLHETTTPQNQGNDANNSTAVNGESQYAKLETKVKTLNRSEYVDFRRLAAKQLKPI